MTELGVWRSLVNAVRGRPTLISDEPLSRVTVLTWSSRDVGVRLICALIGLVVTIGSGLLGTALLRGQDHASDLVHHEWAGIGAFLVVALTVAATRSELWAVVQLTVLGPLAAAVSTACAWPWVIEHTAPDGALDRGGYLAIGMGIGVGLGGRAIIARRRARPVLPAAWGASFRRAAWFLVTFVLGTLVIYWWSQKTIGNEPASNARSTALAAAITVGVSYQFLVPVPRSVKARARVLQFVTFVAPIAVAGPIATEVIERSSGTVVLPHWIDGLSLGAIAGLFVGYIVDLLTRPFEGRRWAHAACTLFVFGIFPTVRTFAFEHTSIAGMVIAPVGALGGFVLGAALAAMVVRQPERMPPPLPDVRVVYFAISNPPGTPQLQLSLEARSARGTGQAGLEDSLFGERFEFTFDPAAQFPPLQTLLVQADPIVFHLSGHAAQEFFYFHGASVPDRVPFTSLATVILASARSLKVAVINACDSLALAQLLVAQIEYAIGLTGEVSDAAACTFSSAFYRALGDGFSVEEAFALAMNALRATRQKVDADRYHLLVNPGRPDTPLVLAP